MLKIFAAIILILLVFGLSLLAALPAPLVWHQFVKQMPSAAQAVEETTVSGTLWEGAALLSLPDLQPAVVNWGISPWGLFTASIPVNASIRNDFLQLNSTAALRLDKTVSLGSEGWIDAALINRLLRREGITTEGRLLLQELVALVDLERGWPLEAEGLLGYAGGQVAYRLRGQSRNATVPPLRGELNQIGERLQLALKAADSDALLATFTLDRRRDVTVEIRRRMLDLLEIEYGPPGDADRVVFKVQKRLLLQ